MKYMLETNICIYIIKHRPEKVLLEFMKHAPGDICISSITYSELMYGVHKSSKPQQNMLALTLFLSPVTVLDFDSAAGAAFGEILAELEARGTPIGPMDTLIAAHARSAGLTLVTNNTREFRRVKGLDLENWAE